MSARRYLRPSPFPLAALAVVALLGCTKRIDNKALQGDILKDTAAKGVKLAAVSCPPDKPMLEGTKFECSCSDTQGTVGAFDVELANGHGRVEWKLRNKFMNMRVVGDSLENKLSKRFGQLVDVTCPSENILIKQGVGFSCDVKVGEKNQRITLVAKDDDGSDWDETLVAK